MVRSRYVGQGIYGPIPTLVTMPSIYGNTLSAECPEPDCSELQNVGTYIVQMTNILGNLERNKKVNIADIAFDRMTADINSKIATVTTSKVATVTTSKIATVTLDRTPSNIATVALDRMIGK